VSRATLLPAEAWTPRQDAGWEASVIAAVTGRVLAWAQGWEAAEEATLRAGGAPPEGFLALGDTAFAAIPALAGLSVRILAPAPPSRCVVLGVAEPAGSATLAGFWPRAMLRAPRPAAIDLDAARRRLDAALVEQDLDGAIALLADMLLLARDAPQTMAAAAGLLAHLAQHPLCRSPRLGALVAALTE
jgi:hypothetical protein